MASQPPGTSFSDPTSWPKLNVLYLDECQTDYEARIRNFILNRDRFQHISQSSKMKLNDEIRKSPYDLASIPHVYSKDPATAKRERHDDMADCKNGVLLLKEVGSIEQKLHRAMHIYFRLRRIDFGDDTEAELKKKPLYEVVHSVMSDVMSAFALEEEYRNRALPPVSCQSLTTTISEPIVTIATSGSHFQSTHEFIISRSSDMTSNPMLMGFSTSSESRNIVQTGTIPRTPHAGTHVHFSTLNSPGISHSIYTGIHDPYATTVTENNSVPVVRTTTHNLMGHMGDVNQNLVSNITPSSVPLVTSANNNYLGTNPSVIQPVRDIFQFTQSDKSSNRTSNGVQDPYYMHIPAHSTMMSYGKNEYGGFHQYPAQSQVYPPHTMNSTPRILPPTNPFSTPVSIHDNSFLDSTHMNLELNNLRQELANLRQQNETQIQRHANQTDSNTLKKIQCLPRWNIRFSGDKIDDKYQTIEDYIAAIYTFIDSQKVNETDMINNILPTLGGAARTWFLTLANKDNMSLRQFFNQLRSRFADKRNKVEIISSLCTRKYDPKSGYIIEHIDQLMLEMAYLNMAEADQLNIVLKTLPSEARGFAITRSVSSVSDLKQLCQEIYPPSVKFISKKKPEDKFVKKVMKVECESECDSEEENDESEDSDMVTQLCHLVSKFQKSNPNKKRNSKQFEPRTKSFNNDFKSDPRREFRSEPKNEPITKNRPERTDVIQLEWSKIQGNLDTVCYNCRQFGHSHEMCSAPKLRPFCYRCGRPDVYSADCPSKICVTNRDTQKN